MGALAWLRVVWELRILCVKWGRGLSLLTPFQASIKRFAGVGLLKLNNNCGVGATMIPILLLRKQSQRGTATVQGSHSLGMYFSSEPMSH